jgi:predicted RNA-binding protein with PUA-like domain
MAAMQHWLMKTEPDTFSIDDLERVRVEPWTGVRNYTARNSMRDGMQVGDGVLFYHSSATPPGVAGLAVVSRTGVVDATQFEPSSPYYDPSSKRDAPRWICVDVEFVEKLPRLIAARRAARQPGPRRHGPPAEGLAAVGAAGERRALQGRAGDGEEGRAQGQGARLAPARLLFSAGLRGPASRSVSRGRRRRAA